MPRGRKIILRPIRTMVDTALKSLDRDFDALYSSQDTTRFQPETAAGAAADGVLHDPSERRLMEQINFNLLFRWFVGFSMDDGPGIIRRSPEPRPPVGGEVAYRFFAEVLGQADRAGLLSKKRFSVDGTLIEALASLKSYRPKDEDGPPGDGIRKPSVDFTAKRSRDTHESRPTKMPFVPRDQGRRGQADLSRPRP